MLPLRFRFHAGLLLFNNKNKNKTTTLTTTTTTKTKTTTITITITKQRRQRQAYFDGFGPKYVEWLSDWSFNVVFDDAEGAKKAAAAKSFGLPDTLPKEIEVRCPALYFSCPVHPLFFFCPYVFVHSAAISEDFLVGPAVSIIIFGIRT